MDTKKYLLYGGASIVILVIGIAMGSFMSNKGGATPVGSTNTYQAGWDAAKKRLSDIGYAIPTMAESVSVSGTVKEVRADGMTIAIRPLEPLADPALDTRSVKFDANTKFYRVEQKDPIKYQQEVNAFNLKMRANSSAPLATSSNVPQPSVRTAVDAQAIKAGMIVSATAASNIKEVREFVATEVIVQVIAAPNAVPLAPAIPPASAPSVR